MAELTLTLFGSPCLARDGVPLHLRSRKCLALLAYLAVTGIRHGREHLAALFWPESDGPHAQNSLRYTLSALRRALDGEWLLTDRQSIRLDGSEREAADAVRFREHLRRCQSHGHAANETCVRCLPLLEEAVELHQGEFMAGFTLRDSPGFDEWQASEGQGLRRDLAWALERLIAGWSAEGDVQQAIAYGMRWLAVDPLSEGAHRALMRLYAGSGRRSQALIQYASCAQVLEEGFGVGPTAETKALYEAIKVGRAPDLQIAPFVVPELPSAPRHNLPAQPTPFVGRTVMLDQMDRLLGDPACRLLTVVGPGGIGKTRLAIRAAEEHLDCFTDGVCFVPLAPVQSPDLLPSAILHALRVPRQGAVHPRDQLLRTVRSKEQLLILDNFEHLTEGATLVTEMVAEAPCVKVMVTSRQRLNVRGEWLLPVEGMAYPGEERAEVDEEEFSAIALFVRCARRVQPGFSLSSAGPESVARVCRLVEGMPLAIELAASWVETMPCSHIAREIEGGVGFLATTFRDMPPRHRSMRTVFESSWRLLPDEEKRILLRLSVFRGGFHREAAEAVAGASLEMLSRLVHRSWLRPTGTGRFEMHEMIRQFCEDGLGAVLSEQAAGQGEGARHRHSHYYAAFLQQREPHLFGQRQREAFEDILEEMDNVRVAWNWAVERGDLDVLDRCVRPLWAAGMVRGWYREVEQQLEGAATAIIQHPDLAASCGQSRARERALHLLADVLSAQADMCKGLGLSARAVDLAKRALALLRDVGPSARRDRLRIRSLVSLGWLLWISGDGDRGRQHLRDALSLALKAGDPWCLQQALLELGTVYRNDGRYDEAERLLMRAVAMADETGEQWGKAGSLDSLSFVLWARGEYARAETLAKESLRIRQEIGDRSFEASCHHRLAEIGTALGKYDQAAQAIQRGLDIAEEISHPTARNECLIAQASLALAMGHNEDAKRFSREGFASAREAGNFVGGTVCLVKQGQAAYALGEHEEARDCFCRGLAAAMRTGTPFTVLDALLGLVHLAAAEGDREAAAEITGLVLHHPATIQVDRERAQLLLSELAAHLPPEALRAAVARGQAKKLEEAAAEMLGGCGGAASTDQRRR